VRRGDTGLAEGLRVEVVVVQEALQRLEQAIGALEAAAGRHSRLGRQADDLATELQLMRADRQKLAGLLDEATARSRTLDQTRRQIGERVDRAIGAIRSVVEAPVET
jgi:DNA-binding transcriptional regulator YhcF (GntR family)